MARQGQRRRNKGQGRAESRGQSQRAERRGGKKGQRGRRGQRAEGRRRRRGRRAAQRAAEGAEARAGAWELGATVKGSVWEGKLRTGLQN